MMTVEEKPDVTYSDVGGCKDAIEKMREVVEIPLLNPEKFVNLGIDPPKGHRLANLTCQQACCFFDRQSVQFFGSKIDLPVDLSGI